jgi:hypothetical protein
MENPQHRPGLTAVCLPERLPQLAQGDDRWARRNAVWREREPALPWPLDLLESFSLRMAGHGMSISRPLMLSDKCYALRQLADGQTMGDETLRLLSVQMFRHFEACQSGIQVYH